jgi:hypothetical protein
MQLTVRALRYHGYGKVCKGEPSDFTVHATNISRSFVATIFIGLSILISQLSGWSLTKSVGVVLLGLFGAVVFSVWTKFPAGVFSWLALALWVGGGAYLIFRGDGEMLPATYVLPFGIVAGSRWSWRALKLVVRVPLFIPLALLIVLLPLLTEDPWSLAAAAGPRIATLAIISLTPLAVLVILRIRRVDLASVADGIRSKIQGQSWAATRGANLILTTRDSTSEEEIEDDTTKIVLDTVYSKATGESLKEAVAVAGRSIRWQAVRKLGTLVFGVFLAVFALLYLLAWAVVPPSLANRWSDRPIPLEHLNIAGASLLIPLGPYLLVAALLATVAGVAFLGFVLTEDQYTEALWDAVLRDPMGDYLLMALPYLWWKQHKDDQASSPSDPPS